MTIDIAIATLGNRIEQVGELLLPQVEGVRYVVSWQGSIGIALPENIRERLSSECGGKGGDVDVYRFNEKGLSRNRNNAIDHCRGDIVIMGDDDVVYTVDGIENVRRSFEENSDLDLAVFRVGLSIAKPYPTTDCRLGLPFPKGYWVSMIEVTFRRDRIGDLRCHPELGLGAEYFQSGEDEMFVISAIKRGLNCRFVNKTLCSHPSVSTGGKVTPGILRGQGFIMGIMYPWSSFLRILLKACRLNRTGKTGFLVALKYLTQGFTSKNKLLDCPPRYRW